MPRIITLTPNPALDFSFDADGIEPNQKLRCKNLRTFPGGGGINVARAAHRLGASVLAIHTAGGIYGDALCAALSGENVPAIAIPVAGETRPAFHAHDKTNADDYRFNFPGDALHRDEIDHLLDSLKAEAAADDIIIGSGSLPPGTPDDFWARAARIARNNDTRFILDSTNGEAAALAEGIFLLRKNRREAETLAGRELRWPDDHKTFAQEFIRDHNVERLILTHRDHALMASATGVVFATRVPVNVVSAVGAGDSFVAALAFALINGEDEQAALNFALAGAGATLMSEGTALFEAATVHQLFSKTS